MVLHLVQRSPFQHSALRDCLNLCADTDAILLMEDGVLGVNHTDLKTVTVPLYALQDDLSARGLNAPDTIKACGYDEFVELCGQYKQVVSWF